MCRAGNSVSSRYKHLEGDEDSLAIWFGHMKNDQEGDRQLDPQHIFANPMEPDICPILSLAIYSAVVGLSKTSLLFPGQNQYDRYSRILKGVMDISSVAEEMDIAGRVPSDYGSHSARKGSSTYVSGCYTGGPSSASVCLRAGWNLPGVQDTYVRYEAAGDGVVGRFIAGLPYETPDFAILPPFFDSVDDNACTFMLASLVHHSEHLKQTLSQDHLLFSTSLFGDTTLLSELTTKEYADVGKQETLFEQVEYLRILEWL
ncbi:hypothetical protein GQ600_24851 [Phytophthora cactorum]|nr:hypothetical protein GQ600_24851 [Phytophthora cactorum]